MSIHKYPTGNGGGWKQLPPFLIIDTKKKKMIMNKKKEALERRLARLESSLSKEQARTTQVMNNIGWGTGMRCSKRTPSFRKEDELKEKIQLVKKELTQLK